MWTNTGSLHYRAPETFSLGYEQKIDIWSLGVIFYELLTGEVPFNSNYEK
jgi:serine/threonine protein kinase